MRKSVTAVHVVDVEKRRLPSKHYVYVIEVTWDDGSTVTIYRRYSSFFDLQTSLLNTFPEEGGSLNPDDRTIPFLPEKKYFGRSHIREVAEKRLEPIDKYCKILIGLDTKISRCHGVLTFFEPTADDLSPKNNEKKPGDTNISKPKLLEQYEAVFDYQKQAKDQVDLKVGQSVQVIEKYETGWWLVNTEYEEGYAPGTFLKKADGQAEEVMATCNGEKYTCTQNYTAEGPDDHTLNIGDEVEVLQKSLDGWWWVRYNGKIGWAPATCLKALEKTEAHANIPVQIVSTLSDVSKLMRGNKPAVSMMTNAQVVPRRPNSLAETDSESNYVSVYESSDYDDDEESHYSQLNSVYRHSVLPPPRQNTVENVPAQINAEAKRTKFVTCAEYVDSVGDGISFSAGQEVDVQQKTDSGWYYIKIGNESGWAPSSYLEEVSLDEKGMQEAKAEENEDADDGDDEDDEDDAKISPAKRIQNILASKLPPTNSSLDTQSGSSEPNALNTSFNDDLKYRLSPSGSNTSINSLTNSTNSGPPRKSAIKRPNIIPPAPPKRLDLPCGQSPLPAPKMNSPLPPPTPPPPPPVQLSASKKPSVSPSSSVGPTPPPPTRPHPGIKPHSVVSDSAAGKSKDSAAGKSKDTSNNSGNLATDLQSRLAKLKANFDSSSNASSKKQQPQPKEKPVIIHGVHIKGSGPSVTGNNPNFTETKSRPLPLIPPAQKSADDQRGSPITPASPCNVDNNPLDQFQKDAIQSPSSSPNICDSSVVVPASKFAEKLNVFKNNTDGDNIASPKKSSPNVPAGSSCRGLALLQRQKEKFMEEAAESNHKPTNENLESEPKVSSLRNNFETPCKLSPNSGVASNTAQSIKLKPATPTKVNLKPIHKVKPTTIPAKAIPDLPTKPKVSPCKPKLGTVTNNKNKDSATNMANKINKFEGSNQPSSTNVSPFKKESPKSQPTKEKALQQTANANLSEMDFSPAKKTLQKSPKATDRLYKACSAYIAESDGEVSFEKGIDIDVVEKHESGWWLVKVGDEEGWAPSNHIAEVKPLPPSKPLPPNKPLPKPHTSPCNKSTNKTANPVIYDDNTKNFSSENNSPTHYEKNNKNENLNNNIKDVVVSEDSLDADNNLESKDQFMCLSDFSAFEEGEISIDEGMLLKVLDSSNTDWWHVMLPSGEDGWAPANCIGSICDV